MILGIDIGGTNIRFGFVNSNQEIISFRQARTSDVFVDNQPIIKLGDKIENYISEKIADENLEAISLGMPSTIDRSRTIALQTPNIRNIPDLMEVVSPLEKKFGIPIFLNRDVNNLLLFDLFDLGIESAESVCGIYFGTGIGNSLYLHGKFWNGYSGVSGELGHIPVLNNDNECGCGNIGCLEANIGGAVLERLRQRKFPEITIGDVFKLKSATNEIKEFVKSMGQIVAIEENILDPQYIIVGGGLIYMNGFPRTLFEEYAHKSTRKPYPEKNMKIYYSQPDQKNGVIGAAIYARKRLLEPNFQ